VLTVPVFSAPRYCDSTENKGAFIDIGPDYKLKYTKFEAVPHPNTPAMVSSSSSICSADMSRNTRRMA
jgi:serine/threonine-protein phosphatase 5